MHSTRFIHTLLLLSCLLLSSAAPASAAAAKGQGSILVENRAFLPLWYRTSGAGTWGRWMSLLPGGRHVYANQSQMTVEVSLTGGAKQYTLQAGQTYYHDLASSGTAMRFALDPNDHARGTWHRPKPPEAAEFASRASGQNLFGPLEKFVARSEQFGDEYKLSLRRLAEECRQSGPLPEELSNLKGFTWFFGYLIDRPHDDIILLGVKDPCRPPLDIDCLATAIRAAHEGQIPACSLDEHPDPRYQKSVIRGVPWNTKWAEVMINADYLMKKVGLGTLNPGIRGLTSDWDYDYWLSRANFKLGRTHTYDRWWYNFDAHDQRAVVSRGGEMAVLYRNPVRISTEKKINGHFGTGATSQAAELFAADFTRHMDTLGQHYVSVGQLLALYRLYDLMCHLRNVGQATAPDIDYWTSEYQGPYAGPPTGMPTLSRKETYRWSSGSTRYTLTKSVKGGVNMRMAVSDASLQYADLDAALLERLIAGASP